MSQLARLGDSLASSMEKVNSELLTMTYGAMVTQLIKDLKDIKQVNAELDRMGFSIGLRIIDEFLAKSNIPSCSSFMETCTVVAKVAFKMFLGINADVGKWDAAEKSCSLAFKGNPLDDFVELPEQYKTLHYSNILCGVIRGALHAIQLDVNCEFVQDQLINGGESEIRIILKEVMREEYNDEE